MRALVIEIVRHTDMVVSHVQHNCFVCFAMSTLCQALVVEIVRHTDMVVGFAFSCRLPSALHPHALH